jgi:hypothetical protein
VFEETITLEQYLTKRSMGHQSLRSLTRKEAAIIGVPYPLKHGWPKRFRGVRITPAQQAQLQEVLGEYRDNKQAQKMINRLEKLKESTPQHVWQPIEPLLPKVYRVPRHTFTEKPKRAAVTLSQQKEAAKKFFPNSMAYVATDEFLESFEWRKIRMHAIKKYGARCMCCGATPQTGAVMNVDHIKPRKIFPELALNIDNLQVLCHECNHGKGNWDMTDWRSAEQT